MAKSKSKKKLSFLIITILFIGAMIGGYFTAKYITRNDIFEIIGEKEVTINIGQIYQDEGARAISFGKDISKNIKSENNIDNLTAGKYYIKYTVEDFRYRGIERYRVVIVIDPNETIQEVTNENN